MSEEPTFSMPSGVGGDETTGRYVITFREDRVEEGLAALRQETGISPLPSAADFSESAMDVDQLESAGGAVFPTLGVAVVTLGDEAFNRIQMTAAEDSAILAIEPERIFYALAEGLPALYLKGYLDAVNNLYDKSGAADLAVTFEAVAAFMDDAHSTWGLKATNVMNSRFSGRGIKIAVLDTGLDLQHPDFHGRNIFSQSFVPGEAVQDGNGHGTHCIGTACGFKDVNGRRYGIAHECTIFVGKVLSNGGSAPTGWIIAGMEWAVSNKCHVISMSLGNRVPTPSTAYEQIGQRALRNQSLIVAASGNHRRDNTIPPDARVCGQPANSPSIMAVGAVDNRLNLASFSCGSSPVQGGNVDIVGPGVGVYSSVSIPNQLPVPTISGRYAFLNGTSMATPHVAGIAALWAQARGAHDFQLWQLLVSHARRLPLPTPDVGAGLVQAPV